MEVVLNAWPVLEGLGKVPGLPRKMGDGALRLVHML